MKLELKHVAPYLPYALKWQHMTIDKVLRMDGLEEVRELRIRLSDGLYSYHKDFLKPLLRPLSDITKEIEVNGEKFVPMVKLYEIYPRQTKSLIGFSRDVINSPLEIEYRIVQKLAEWHFDVFGLIEQGLAVDLNTI